MIQLSNITKEYKGTRVIENLNLTIKQTSGIVTLIGPNGAGKSTLLRLLSGILMPQEGEIAIYNKEGSLVSGDLDLRKEVAFISASERVLYFKLSVLDNIILYNVYKGMTKAEIMDNYNKIPDNLGIKQLENRLVETLSTGQKKKVMIVSALCSNCSTIVLDEPTIGLDHDTKLELKRLIKDVSVLDNKLFILSSHDFELLDNISSENIFIFKGKISDKIDENLSMDELIEAYNERSQSYDSLA